MTLNSPANSYNALLFGAKFDDELVLMGCGLAGVVTAVRRRGAARRS